MIQHILKLIYTQRRRNAWIFAELFLVFILMWYIIDYGFVMIHNRLLSRGYDIENTYRVYHKDLTTDSDKESFRVFYDKVKRFPGVQNTFLSGKYWGTTPFAGSFSGNSVKRDTTSAAEAYGAQSKPVSSGDYFTIFNVRSVINPDKLGYLNFSDKNSIVLTENLAKAIFKEKSALGKTVFVGSDPFVVTDVIANQKRYDYELHSRAFFYQRNDSNATDPEIAIRVGDNFSLADFKNQITTSILSYNLVKKNMELMDGTSNNIRLRFGITIFFLLNIALGIIGTFWFRNQSRRSEIGLRMALGSSKKQLQRQYITEAVLLLTLAVIVALSAWIPANRASKVHPVDALRDE